MNVIERIEILRKERAWTVYNLMLEGGNAINACDDVSKQYTVEN